MFNKNRKKAAGANRRAFSQEMYYRVIAAVLVIVIAAVAMVFTSRITAVPASSESTEIPRAQITSVAVTAAQAVTNSAQCNMVDGALNVTGNSCSVELPMYETTVLESFAVTDWQAAPTMVYYRSADESVCTVDKDGTVYGVSEGETVVTVSAENATGGSAETQVQVTVTYADPPVEALTLNRSKVTLRMGGTGSNLTVSCTPEEYADLLTPVFSSSDESICTVDAAGHITAVAPGEAVVTASALGLTAECAVTVKDTQTENIGGIALLSFDHSMIASIGNQTAGRCSWYALRYARTILDGVICSGAGMWSNGVIWSAGGYSDYSADLSSCLSKMYSELNAGRPVIVHLQNVTVNDGDKHVNRVSSYEYWESSSGWSQVFYPHIATSAAYGHWVCVVGYREGADPNNLKESDFFALDPARVTDGSRICVTNLLDGTLWIGNSPLKVAG